MCSWGPTDGDEGTVDMLARADDDTDEAPDIRVFPARVDPDREHGGWTERRQRRRHHRSLSPRAERVAALQRVRIEACGDEGVQTSTSDGWRFPRFCEDLFEVHRERLRSLGCSPCWARDAPRRTAGARIESGVLQRRAMRRIDRSTRGPTEGLRRRSAPDRHGLRVLETP